MILHLPVAPLTAPKFFRHIEPKFPHLPIGGACTFLTILLSGFKGVRARGIRARKEVAVIFWEISHRLDPGCFPRFPGVTGKPYLLFKVL